MSKIVQALALCLTAALSSPAHAQSYPDRPIRMIVSIAAGSVTDVIMRAAATELAPRLGQQLVIENKGGASGIPAAQACAGAAPDGYTVCVIYHSTLVYNPLLFSKLPYDPDKDFELVARLFFLIEAVAASPALGVASMASLKTLAQSKPQGLNYGTLGPGSFPELFLKWINNQWGTAIVAIPYRGGGPIAQALAAGEIQVGNMGLGNFIGLAQGGKLKLLAVSAPQRSSLAPDTPTFAEVGLGAYPGRGWWGLAVPKGTPKPIVDRLNAEFVKLFSEPKFLDFLEKQAVVAAAGSPADFAAFIKQDRGAAENLIKLANTPRAEYKPEQP
ncbi:MAG: tripartite tricarboxylate transporter substrate binding protein [Hyphomicrobiales bacterium]|nr:tripartite tricarboxylate transporter substrate binding protein [Hyphomicrobiales bacterium]